MADKRRVSRLDWLEEGKELYGEDPMEWRFRCPSCGYVASLRQWKLLDGMLGAAFSCIGRYLGAKGELFAKTGPCNYAGGGLLRLNPVVVVQEDGHERETFEWADR